VRLQCFAGNSKHQKLTASRAAAQCTRRIVTLQLQQILLRYVTIDLAHVRGAGGLICDPQAEAASTRHAENGLQKLLHRSYSLVSRSACGNRIRERVRSTLGGH
jgi:hypothetical protein